MGQTRVEKRAHQVKMNPVLDAMRRVMTGRPAKKGCEEALRVARGLYEKEPREFLRLLNNLELAHEKRKKTKLERLEKREAAERAGAVTVAETAAAVPPSAPPSEAAGSGPLPDLIARLLGG